jgi:hypothetical protein
MSTPTVAPPPTEPPKSMRWHRRLLGICLIVFAFEIGLFLIVFPWHPAWSMNWIPVHSKRFADLWMSPYFRGVVSGLGLLDVFIALGEAVKQIKSLFVERTR